MGSRTAARFDVERIEMLDAEGRADAAVGVGIPDAGLLGYYRRMVEIRAFDEKATALCRQGKLIAYHRLRGHEATQIVPPTLLKPQDWMAPTHRGHGAYYARGLKLRYILLYWAGDERGLKLPEGSNDVVFSFPVGSHLTQAAGLGLAARLRREDTVVLAYLGDGAAGKGDFHESLTLAGRLKLPVIYLIENHRPSGDFPAEGGQDWPGGPKTLAQTAIAYGAHGVQVDGSDPLAVHQALSDAIERARLGGGPTVAECEVCRPTSVVPGEPSPADLGAWKMKDPVARLRRHLTAKGLWDDDRDMKLKVEAETLVRYEAEEFEGALPPDPLDMFSENYATAPWHLREQRLELEALLELKRGRKDVDDLPRPEGRFP
ncbi:MAG: hypothetical protein HY748_18055 [Elusimicrobia bacterium]|nr:hypothetical protein [Elusimicrobiota bacterium]